MTIIDSYIMNILLNKFVRRRRLYDCIVIVVGVVDIGNLGNPLVGVDHKVACCIDHLVEVAVEVIVDRNHRKVAESMVVVMGSLCMGWVVHIHILVVEVGNSLVAA